MSANSRLVLEKFYSLVATRNMSFEISTAATSAGVLAIFAKRFVTKAWPLPIGST
jgi:hypothetical protein